MSTFLSIFHGQASQPTFVNVVPTQILVTHDTTTHVDSPAERLSHIAKFKRVSRTSFPISGKRQSSLPDTPRTPHVHHTKFTLPTYHGSEELPKGNDNDRGSPIDHASHVERFLYFEKEPKTLVRTLFLLGFLFPIFWVVGAIALIAPLRKTPDLEHGRIPSVMAWEMSVVRVAEIRWAKRCLLALAIEAVFVASAFVIVKWGMKVLRKDFA